MCLTFEKMDYRPNHFNESPSPNSEDFEILRGVVKWVRMVVRDFWENESLYFSLAIYLDDFKKSYNPNQAT